MHRQAFKHKREQSRAKHWATPVPEHCQPEFTGRASVFCATAFQSFPIDHKGRHTAPTLPQHHTPPTHPPVTRVRRCSLKSMTSHTRNQLGHGPHWLSSSCQSPTENHILISWATEADGDINTQLPCNHKGNSAQLGSPGALSCLTQQHNALKHKLCNHLCLCLSPLWLPLASSTSSGVRDLGAPHLPGSRTLRYWFLLAQASEAINPEGKLWSQGKKDLAKHSK